MPEAVGSKGDDVIVSNTREMEKQRRKLDKEIKQRQKDAERKKLKDEKKRQKEAEKQEAKERKKEKKVNASSTLYFTSTIIPSISTAITLLIMTFFGLAGKQQRSEGLQGQQCAGPANLGRLQGVQ